MINRKIISKYNYLLEFCNYKQIRQTMENIMFDNTFYYKQYGYYCNMYRRLC